MSSLQIPLGLEDMQTARIIPHAEQSYTHFIKTGLDNLPAEVQHLLAELKHRETRSHGTYTNSYGCFMQSLLSAEIV